MALNTLWGAQNQQTIVSFQPQLLIGQESSSSSRQTRRALHGPYPSPAPVSAEWTPYHVCWGLLHQGLFLPSTPAFHCALISHVRIRGILSPPGQVSLLRESSFLELATTLFGLGILVTFMIGVLH